MPIAEIIAIGTELLLGEIQDTNTRHLALRLRDAGIDLYRATLVGDNAGRISKLIQEAVQRSQIVITTGGLGPTVDDPTREAVALAAGVELEFKSELWQQIQERFKRFNRLATDNNRRQAYIPAGAIAVENPVGTAPSFIVEFPDCCVISLPGVPREMEHLLEYNVLPYLKQRFELTGTIKARVIHVSGLGESQVDEKVADLETMKNPTVGLLAHNGVVDVRVTAKASSQEEADQMIAGVVQTVLERLGDAVFGYDADTLESLCAQKLNTQNWTLAIYACGLDTELHRRLQHIALPKLIFETLEDPLEFETLKKQYSAGQQQVALFLNLKKEDSKHTLTTHLQSPTKSLEEVRAFGGPPLNAPIWAANVTLDFLRRNL
jgi:competence/damage-inducible protein CinA-like protein